MRPQQSSSSEWLILGRCHPRTCTDLQRQHAVAQHEHRKQQTYSARCMLATALTCACVLQAAMAAVLAAGSLSGSALANELDIMSVRAPSVRQTCEELHAGCAQTLQLRNLIAFDRVVHEAPTSQPGPLHNSADAIHMSEVLTQLAWRQAGLSSLLTATSSRSIRLAPPRCRRQSRRRSTSLMTPAC